jgi:non-heme chloroperoxidase
MMASLRVLLAVVFLVAGASGCSTIAPSPSAPVSASAVGAAGVPLHYLDFGGRGDPVILLAGAGNTAWIYSEFGQQLAATHRVLALTRRGHGASGSPPTGYDPDTLAEDLRLFMDQRGLSRAALVGHSLAGAELTHFATKYPDRVTALVYLDAAYDRSTQRPVMATDPINPPPPTAADRASVAAFIDYVRRTRPDLRRYWTRSLALDSDAMIGIRDDGTAGWLITGETFGQLFSGAAASPPDYSEIRVPALAIYSVEDEDYRLPAGAPQNLKAELDAFETGPFAAWRNSSIAQFRHIPVGTIVEMDAGHHVFLHRPEETLRLVRAFLSRRFSSRR